MTTDGQADRASAPRRHRWYRSLYAQVLVAVAAGVLVGHFFPATGTALKPLGDAFIALVKMMIAPVIFCTVVHGIAAVGDLRKVGRVGLKALVYFETVSTLALVVGLLVGALVQPGAGFDLRPEAIDAAAVETYVQRAAGHGLVETLTGIIPQSFFSAFAAGDVLQLLFVAILVGVAAANLGETGQQVIAVVDVAGQLFFRIIGMIVRLAPIGAFGAMAFTVGKYGASSLANLGELIFAFYAASALFVLLVLGTIARFAGFSIVRLIAYLADELVIVIGTSSSETVLPQLMRKLEQLGARRQVVGLVVPTGYSFNLDGTNLYMTLATLFLAQATNTDLSLSQVLTILGVAMLTSKGASGITGAGFVTLAATLAIVPDIPIGALAVLVGIDKFMSECRALTNVIGNAVATVVISRWEGELDPQALQRALARPLLSGRAADRDATPATPAPASPDGRRPPA